MQAIASFFEDGNDAETSAAAPKAVGVVTKSYMGIEVLTSNDITAANEAGARVLDLSHNVLTSLDPSLPFHKLDKLMTLNISHNR